MKMDRDLYYLHKALLLAKKGIYSVNPNPAVGAIVVKDKEILNPEGLRNSKEFVNHKILDCIGDLYLVGYRLIGSLKCKNGGHSLTNKLLRKIFSDNKNYSLLEIKGKNLPHSIVNNRHKLKSIA